MAALFLGVKLSQVGCREEEIRSRRPLHRPSWRWQRGMERRRIYPAGPRLILAALPHGQVLQIAHTWTNDHNRALVFVRLISLPRIREPRDCLSCLQIADSSISPPPPPCSPTLLCKLQTPP